jgi:PAS domain S-box-containing protein
MADEKTDRIAVSGLEQATTTQEQIRNITHHVNDLTELLRSQREMLQKRGMNLPSGSLDNLRSLKTRVEELGKRLVNTQIELRQLRALAETTALINSALDTDTVLNQVMDTVISLTGAERGYIVMKNRDTGELDQYRVARGLDKEQLGAKSDDPEGKKNGIIISSTIVNQVAQTGEAILTDNASQDDRFADQQSIVSFALRSILAVPLKVRGELIGVVYCDNRILSGLFQASDKEMLVAFGNQAAVAIENARLFEEARQQLSQVMEMRALLKNIFDSIAAGVITVDRNGFVLTHNPSGNSILDYEENANLIGKNLEDILPEMGDEFYAILNKALDEGMQSTLEVQPILKKRGSRYWVIIASPLKDTSGAIQGVALSLDDLTDQKSREAQLDELRRYVPGALMDNILTLDDVNVSGQERTITMISTDVRGFTTFSENLQPEQLMEVINQYLSLASDGINLYEGIVDKYMGDAVTGIFNTQLNPQDDHAIRAVRAAMSIIYDLYALHEIMPEDQRLFYGIGIHTGPAFLGNVGGQNRKEFSALGEAATISKILESNAGRGEVIISEDTYQLVKDAFECEPRKPDKTKGFDDKLKTVYKVVKQKRGAHTGALFLDPELAEMLKDLED